MHHDYLALNVHTQKLYGFSRFSAYTMKINLSDLKHECLQSAEKIS